MRFTTLRYAKEVTKQLRQSVYAKCNSCYLGGSFLVVRDVMQLVCKY